MQFHARAGLLLLPALLVTAAARGHHSYTEFAQEQTIEIEGRLVVAKWQNPHTVLEVHVVDATGATVVWDIETGPLNNFTRRQVPLEAFKVGGVVKVAGWPSKRSPMRMHATNLRGDGGPEVLILTGKPLWGGPAIYPGPPSTAIPAKPVAAGERPTLFRIWVSDVAVEPESRNGFLSRAEVSLTEHAQRVLATFDPVSQSTTDVGGCKPKAFPLLMGQPFPIELVDRGDSIVLRLEEYDAVRTIHMTATSSASPATRSPLGYSVGRWEGETLVVETDRIDAPYFNSRGVPLGENPRAVERFTVSADGQRLAYTVTVTDPEVFTEPARASRKWVAKDGVELLPYNCQPPPATQP